MATQNRKNRRLRELITNGRRVEEIEAQRDHLSSTLAAVKTHHDQLSDTITELCSELAKARAQLTDESSVRAALQRSLVEEKRLVEQTAQNLVEERLSNRLLRQKVEELTSLDHDAAKLRRRLKSKQEEIDALTSTINDYRREQENEWKTTEVTTKSQSRRTSRS